MLKPTAVFKMVIEFALEYRTTRDKILQQRKRLADKRERNKTRGKIWALEGQNGKEGAEVNGNRKQAPVQMNAEQVPLHCQWQDPLVTFKLCIMLKIDYCFIFKSLSVAYFMKFTILSTVPQSCHSESGRVMSFFVLYNLSSFFNCS